MAFSRPHTRTTASSGLGSDRPKYYYVHELPYNYIYELARHLNADRKWSILAGHMKFESTDIGNFANATSGEGGPAEMVLRAYGQRNGKVHRVFEYMHRMKYYVGMRIIKKFVDPKLWVLLDDEDDSEVISRPSEKYSPTAPPYASGVLKLEPDSKNVNCRRSDSDFKRHHKSSKLPSPTGKAPLMVQLPNSNPIKVLSLKDILPDSEKLRNDKAKNIGFQDIDLGSIEKIPHAELREATQGFSDKRIIGRGGFGIVYRGYWKYTDVAIKKLKVSESRSLEHVRQVLTELRVLEKCRFDNILNLYGVSIDNPSEACLVYQFMPGGSLDDRLRRKTAPLTWSQRAVIARGTARGLNFLHTVSDSPLVHGDVKPANILLDINLEPKLGDFGLTREGPADDQTHRFVSHVHGTRCYLPEEYVHRRELSYEVDVYSFGLVLLELATALKVYDERRSPKKLNQFIEKCRNDNEHWKYQDPSGGQGGPATFEMLIELGLKCSALLKSDRPDMGTVLGILMSGRLPQGSPATMPTGYSRDPTVTVNQNMANINLPVTASRSPRLSPTDNLQVPSPVPPSATTNISPGPEVNQPTATETPVPPPTPRVAALLPDLSVLNVSGNTVNSEELSDTSPN